MTSTRAQIAPKVLLYRIVFPETFFIGGLFCLFTDSPVYGCLFILIGLGLLCFQVFLRALKSKHPLAIVYGTLLALILVLLSLVLGVVVNTWGQ